MYEIRIHGRGGQGSVTAAYLIANAAFFDGKESQAFPSFGVERTGAPVEAFARISNKKIRIREHIKNPDYILIQDATLINSADVFHGIKETTRVIINTDKTLKELRGLPQGVRLYLIPATKIAVEIIGKPIVNTILLGYFSGISGLIKLDSVEKSINKHFEGETAEKNVSACEKAFKGCSKIKEEKSDEKFYPPIKKEADAPAETVILPGTSVLNKTGSWRSFRPVFNHEKCIACRNCERICPEGCVFQTKETNNNGRNFFESDLDYCKGCGLCAMHCPVKCIKMELEEK